MHGVKRGFSLVGVMLLSLAWLAAPAHAATVYVDATGQCALGVTLNVTIQPGDTVELIGCTAGQGSLSTMDAAIAAHIAAQPNSATLVFDSTLPMGYYPQGFYFVDQTWNPIGYSYVNVTVGSAAGSSEGSLTPPMIEQALPLPASGSCADIDSSDALWAKTDATAWVKGWQKWHDQSGAVSFDGYACVRWVQS